MGKIILPVTYHGIRHIRARVNHPQANGKIKLMARTRDSLARENEELHDLVLLKESYNGTMRSSHRAVSITMTLLMFSGTDCPLNGSWDMHRGGGMRKVNPGKINPGYHGRLTQDLHVFTENCGAHNRWSSYYSTACWFVCMDQPYQSSSGKWGDDRIHTKNLNMIQPIIIITIEYFSPAITLPSPIWPATRPEKKA